jgi:hypothetical protein
MLTKTLKRFEVSQAAMSNLLKEDTDYSTNRENYKRFDYSQFEKWVVFDSNLNDSSVLDQIIMFKGKSINSNANISDLPGSKNFFFLLI